MEREVLKNKYSNGFPFVVKSTRLKNKGKIFNDVMEVGAKEISDSTTLEEVKKEIVEELKKRGEIIEEKELEVRAKGWKSFLDARAIIESKNLPEMTLDEINDEIAKMREERKERFERARKSFYKIRADIAKQNLPEMTLDEVNAEISKMREEMEAERRAKE